MLEHPPGHTRPEFTKAEAQTEAYFAARAAGFDLKVMVPMVRQFDALTFDLIRWTYNQIELGRARKSSILLPSGKIADKQTMRRRSASERFKRR
jgi:hypothetical protein